MSDPVAEVTEEVKNVSVGENAIYTSDSRGSDVGGEGTYKVPFKTVMKVGSYQDSFNRDNLYCIYLGNETRWQGTIPYHLCRREARL